MCICKTGHTESQPEQYFLWMEEEKKKQENSYFHICNARKCYLCLVRDKAIFFYQVLSKTYILYIQIFILFMYFEPGCLFLYSIRPVRNSGRHRQIRFQYFTKSGRATFWNFGQAGNKNFRYAHIYIKKNVQPVKESLIEQSLPNFFFVLARADIYFFKFADAGP